MRAPSSPVSLLRAPRGWMLVVVLSLACGGCFAGQASQKDAIFIHSTWQSGLMPPDSMAVMREALVNLGQGAPQDPGSLTALCRITVGNPSALVRADALKAGWALAAQIPVEAYRADPVDSASFNQRALRLDQLLDGEDTSEGDDVFALIDWVGSFRFPPARVALALDLAEAVTSRALVHDGDIGQAFEQHVGGTLRHALTLVTMYAADDKSAVVRQEAATAARFMAPEAAVVMLAGMMQREPEAQVVFEAVDSLQVLRASIPVENLRQLLLPLQESHDVAVRHRADDLVALLTAE